MAPLLEGLSDALIRNQTPELGWLAYAAVTSIVLFALAVSVFRRLEPRFAESI